MFSKNMKLMVLTFLTFLVFWGCQENVSDYRSGDGAVVVLSLNDGDGGSGILHHAQVYPLSEATQHRMFRPRKQTAQRQGGLAKSAVPDVINRVEVSFYNLGIDYLTLEQNMQDTTIYQQLIELELRSHPNTYDEWLAYGTEYLSILTRNHSGFEQRAELDVVNGYARGEFMVQEGLKVALMGLFDNNEITYIGESDIFLATPEDTAYVQTYLAYAGPMAIEIFDPQDSLTTASRVAFVSGEFIGRGRYPSTAMLQVNGAYSQEIAVDPFGSFTTSAILPERVNTLEVSGFDSLNSRTATSSVQVNFIGTFPELRATLSWNGQGDLDLHMANPIGQECFFGNSTIGGMELVADNVFGYGPETISVVSPQTGLYTVTVENFSGTLGLTATVKVFRYNLALDREELVEELTHVFSTIDPWLVGEYTF